MTIYDIVRKMQMMLNDDSALSTIDRANLTSKLIEEFEDNFRIVPKEEWGVIYNSQDAGREVSGGFSSEAEAKRFASEWNKKQDEFVEEILSKNPNAEFGNCSYLTIGKVRPVKEKYRDWWKYDHELKEQSSANSWDEYRI